MTTLTLSKIKLVNRGTYSNTATYSAGDIVIFQNNSFVYKSTTPATGAPLFLETYTGNISSNVVNTSNVVNITFSGSFTTNTSLEPIVTGEHFIYGTIFEPGTKIKTINSKSGNTWSITLTEGAIKNWANNANAVPVTVSARRVANRTEIVLNPKHWDKLSASANFRGAWSTGTTYYEGDLVTISENTYRCTNAHNGINPLWDNSGVWEPYALGTHREPHNRITNLLRSSPFNWRGHPYIPNPNWGTANTYTGIPWTLPDSVKNSIHAPGWNESVTRGMQVYRGEASFVDGEGMVVAHGGAGYYGFPAYQAVLNETGAQHLWDYYSDTPSHRQYGNKKAFGPYHTPPKCIQYTQGWNNRFMLMSNGQVLYSGDNSYGQSGVGTGTDISALRAWTSIDSRNFDGRKIVKINTNSSVVRTGSVFVVMLDEYGEVWTAGWNGNWGLGDAPDLHNPNTGGSQTGTTQTMASNANKTVYTKLNKEIKFNNKRIVDIFTNHYSVTVLDEDGYLWSWGQNTYGQLGFATTDTGLFNSTTFSKSPYRIPIDWSSYGGIQKVVVSQQGGSGDSLWVLDGQGHIWNSGRNNIGQLGRGNTTDDSTASALVRTSSTASWTIGGTIKNFWLTGDDAISLIGWFLDGSNRLWGVGYNGHRNLSTNSTTNQTVPVQALGPKGDMTNIVTVTSSKGSGAVTQHALDTEGQPYATGYNAFGDTGIGHSSYTDLTTGATRNAQFGQAVGASWVRPFLPNTMHKKIVDIMPFGDYEGTLGYGHSNYTYWLSDEGEILTAGEQGPASARNDPHGNILNPTTPQGF